MQGTRRFLALYLGASCNQCYSLIIFAFISQAVKPFRETHDYVVVRAG